MTRWLLLGLLATVIGSGLILLVSADSGYILISIGPYTLEMSFWFGVLLLLLFVFVLRKLMRFLGRVRNTLAGSVSWISESRDKRVERRTQRGLIHFIEGNWRAAKKELLAAARMRKQPLIQYLAAANSALELGEYEEARFLLEQAEKIAPENEHAIQLCKARLEIKDHRFEHALALLESARAYRPDDAVVLNLLKRVYLQTENWSALLDLLPRLKSSKSLEKDELTNLEIVAWKGQLAVALDKAAEMNPQPWQTWDNVWKGLPADVRKDPAVVSLYARKLIQADLRDRAMSLLVRRLKQNWHPELLWLYGTLVGEDKKQQLIQAEAWLREHPGDPDLLFVLGKLARANELWGKAREYFEKSLALKPVAYTYAELASLLAQLGEHEQSVECYRKGLLLPAP